jgi:hypothetical protein
MVVIDDLGALAAGATGRSHGKESQAPPSSETSQLPFLLPARPKILSCNSPEWAQGIF